MLADFWTCCLAAWRFRGYKPQHVTLQSVNKWLCQFSKTDRKVLRLLLSKVIYIAEKAAENTLVKLNQNLLKRFADAGIASNKIVYISIGGAASSSFVMLSMLRDAARLERQQCHFVNSEDAIRLNKVTNKLGEGAIVYVDDFIGTGKQFWRSRNFVAEYVVGNFAEFLLAPCICEEAVEKLNERGVEPITDFIHLKVDRPLHFNSNTFDDRIKQQLIGLCLKIHPKEGLGFKKLATMVVFYRNSPNTMPLLLRGSLYQKPYVGVFPRTTDLPIEIRPTAG